MDKDIEPKVDVMDFMKKGENYLDVLMEHGLINEQEAKEYLGLAQTFIKENQEIASLVCELFLRFFLNGKPQTLQSSDKIDKLAEYFTSSFKGIGPSHPIDFYGKLKDALCMRRNDIDYARVALMIYRSDKMLSQKRPKSFAQWYRFFCESVGCGYHKYKPCQLRASENLQKELYYL